MNNLVDAERAAAKYLKDENLRGELLRMAVEILEHRIGGGISAPDAPILCANDFKAAWACLCRTGPQSEFAGILRNTLGPTEDAGDSDDSDDPDYDEYDPESDGMSVDDPHEQDSSRSESEMELDEELIVLGPDSETESDEENEERAGGQEGALVDKGKQEMAQNMSLVANALLESMAAPEEFNQLQVRLF